MSVDSERAVKCGSPKATEDLGHRLGATARPGDMIAVTGPLGAGKTVLARGVAAGLGVEGFIPSPSFHICLEHPAHVPLRHVDAYLSDKLGAFLDEGLGDWLIDGASCVLVEWADRLAGQLPRDRLEVLIHVVGEEERTVSLKALGPVSRRHLVQALPAP